MSLSEQTEPQMRDELGPYDEGWNACLYGHARQTNPYLHEECEREEVLAWFNGWGDCMQVSPTNVKGRR